MHIENVTEVIKLDDLLVFFPLSCLYKDNIKNLLASLLGTFLKSKADTKVRPSTLPLHGPLSSVLESVNSDVDYIKSFSFFLYKFRFI